MRKIISSTFFTLLFASYLLTLNPVSADESDDLSEQESTVEIYGFVSTEIGQVDSQNSWLEGGFGRFDQGRINDDSFVYQQAEIQLALEWSVSDSLLVYLHARGRNEDATASTKPFGLVEGFVEYTAYENETDALTFQLGQIFLPTSHENTNALWQSPYTLTFSSWNTWIAQEFRPVSFNMSYQTETTEGNQLTAAVGVFQGNDSLGSQLAWGGWRMGRRLSVTNEVLPLGPLFSLADNAAFGDQRNDGSKPFAADLDKRLGIHAQLIWRNPESFNIRASYVDNRGDRALYQGEYAWDTTFINLGFQSQLSSQWELLGEFSSGSTGMGTGIALVDVDFENIYLMASWKGEANRVSLRYEQFEVVEKDFSIAENNNDDGSAWTLAWFYQNDSPWRFAVELVALESENAAQLQSGFTGSIRDNKLTFEIRRSIN